MTISTNDTRQLGWQIADDDVMHTFQIENRLSGVVLGRYEAYTPSHALHLMARDACYRGLCHMEAVAPTFFDEIVVTNVTETITRVHGIN